jgi:hypothetical protein
MEKEANIKLLRYTNKRVKVGYINKFTGFG